ncbi:methyltransferase domain-containing protein [Candidatus Peregrinibacteria bacterium]|jgi:ubiquinone/menaquinone biosynthesis C-methylase UbiE|nr:methyltransferase domain-containing protein [Candidatus Peregrinibacteria bacterium]
MLRIFNLGRDNEKDRVEWVKKILLKIPKGYRILDAGAGELPYKKLCKHLDYVSQDFAEYDGKGDDSGLQTGDWDGKNIDIVSDITNIPEEDASFEAIMCIEVFEHLPEPVKAIKEFSRLLKKDGYLIITAPFCSLTHFAPYHFCTGFNKYFYEKHLPDYGFEILEVTRNGNFFHYIAQEINRIPSVAVQYSNGKSKFKLYLLEILLLLVKFPLFVLIWFLNKKDKNSAELLCHDYHIFAKKITD